MDNLPGGNVEEEIQWFEDGGEWDTTSQPLLETVEEGNAVAVLVAVVFGVLVAISLLFALALIIDCRNRRLAASPASKKGCRKLRLRKVPSLPQFANNGIENGDNILFANSMCENSVTMYPSERVSGIP